MVDVLIADHAMPRMSGEQLARCVRAATPEIRILVLTGFGNRMAARGEQPEDVDWVLSKPVTVLTLRESLARRFQPDAAKDTGRAA